MSEIFYGFLNTLKNLWVFDDAVKLGDVYFTDYQLDLLINKTKSI